MASGQQSDHLLMSAAFQGWQQAFSKVATLIAFYPLCFLTPLTHFVNHEGGQYRT